MLGISTFRKGASSLGKLLKIGDHNDKFICNRCLNYFYDERKLNEHETFCKDFDSARTTVPEANTSESKALIQ